jgi:hypothetical protein
MDAIALSLFQFEDGPPLPEPTEQVDVGADRGLDHRYALLLAHRVLPGELLDLGFVI